MPPVVIKHITHVNKFIIDIMYVHLWTYLLVPLYQMHVWTSSLWLFIRMAAASSADGTKFKSCEKLNLWVGSLQKEIKGLFRTMLFSSPIC